MKILYLHRFNVTVCLLLCGCHSIIGPDSSQNPRLLTGKCAAKQEVLYNNIRITFDKDYPVGAFADGTPFVVGPAVITAFDPPSLSNGSRRMHGAMLNPPVGGDQGYDDSIETPVVITYQESLNVALDVSPNAAQPKTLRIEPGHVLISTRSKMQADQNPQLEDAAVLTFTDKCYPNTAFRPSPWEGTPKVPTYYVEDLDIDRAPMITPAPGMPDPQATLSMVDHFWLDHPRGWSSRKFHPTNWMPDYGREIGVVYGRAELLAYTIGVPANVQRQLRIHLFQKGLDLYEGIFVADGFFEGNGGNNFGRWALLGINYILSGRDEFKNALGSTENGKLSERDQFFFIEQRHIDIGAFPQNYLGKPEFRFSTSDSSLNWQWYPADGGNDYRMCCTSHATYGSAAFLLGTGLREAANHEAYFRYHAERYVPLLEAALAEGDPRAADWYLVWYDYPDGNYYDPWSFATYKQQAGL